MYWSVLLRMKCLAGRKFQTVMGELFKVTTLNLKTAPREHSREELELNLCKNSLLFTDMQHRLGRHTRHGAKTNCFKYS